MGGSVMRINFEKVECVIGIDVHSKILVCHAKSIRGEEVIEESQSFPTFKRGIRDLVEWARKFSPDFLIMESTGIYWKSPYHFLEKAGFLTFIVNACHVKGMAGKKTDMQDAKWLAEVGFMGCFTPSYIPKEQWQDLQSSYRLYVKNVLTLQTYKNRENKAFDDAGFRLGTVFSDTSGKNARIAKACILKGMTPEQVLAHIDTNRLKASEEELLDAFDGDLRECHILNIQICQRIEAALEAEIKKTSDLLTQKVMKLEPELLKYLVTIPGFDIMSAVGFIIEIGGKNVLDAFASEERFSSWLGVCPGNNESAGKRKSGKARKGNKFLRRILCEVAQAAVRTKNTTFMTKFNCLKIRLGFKKSVFAIAHKISRIAFLLIKNSQSFVDPNIDYQQEMLKKNASRKIKELLKLEDWLIHAENMLTGETLESPKQEEATA